jgi:hypothetical protein
MRSTAEDSIAEDRVAVATGDSRRCDDVVQR